MTNPVIWSRLGLVSPLYARMNAMPATPVSGISIDTRTLQPGDLFFAIKGDHSDGHDHVAAAFEKGAAAVRMAGRGDVLVVAGKGHETGQIVGDKILPFSDHQAVRAALEDAAS